MNGIDTLEKMSSFIIINLPLLIFEKEDICDLKYKKNKAVEILQAIIEYIDYPHDSSVHEKCREMNRFCLNRRKVKVYHCYEYMIGDLITQLNRVVGNLSSQSKAYQIIIALTENHKICH